MALVITETAEALIGVEGPPDVMEVEKGLIKHFAHSMAWPNEPNPLYFNLKLVYIVNALNAWMGDDGWIRKIGAEYRRQDLVNTTLTATGAVRAKRQEQGENLVDLDVWVENEQGEKTTPGHATVVLPGRV